MTPKLRVQAAVVGLSCRHDVMELLEKRVRSRFSHRKQLIPEMEEKDFDKARDCPRDVLAAMLTVPDPSGSTGRSAGPVQQWNAAVAHILSSEAVLRQLKLMMNQGTAMSICRGLHHLDVDFLKVLRHSLPSAQVPEWACA